MALDSSHLKRGPGPFPQASKTFLLTPVALGDKDAEFLEPGRCILDYREDRITLRNGERHELAPRG